MRIRELEQENVQLSREVEELRRQLEARNARLRPDIDHRHHGFSPYDDRHFDREAKRRRGMQISDEPYMVSDEQQAWFFVAWFSYGFSTACKHSATEPSAIDSILLDAIFPHFRDHHHTTTLAHDAYDILPSGVSHARNAVIKYRLEPFDDVILGECAFLCSTLPRAGRVRHELRILVIIFFYSPRSSSLRMHVLTVKCRKLMLMGKTMPIHVDM